MCSQESFSIQRPTRLLSSVYLGANLKLKPIYITVFQRVLKILSGDALDLRVIPHRDNNPAAARAPLLHKLNRGNVFCAQAFKNKSTSVPRSLPRHLRPGDPGMKEHFPRASPRWFTGPGALWELGGHREADAVATHCTNTA